MSVLNGLKIICDTVAYAKSIFSDKSGSSLTQKNGDKERVQSIYYLTLLFDDSFAVISLLKVQENKRAKDMSNTQT